MGCLVEALGVPLECLGIPLGAHLGPWIHRECPREPHGYLWRASGVSLGCFGNASGRLWPSLGCLWGVFVNLSELDLQRFGSEWVSNQKALTYSMSSFSFA